LDSRLASHIRRKMECRNGAATPSAANIERFDETVMSFFRRAGKLAPRGAVMPA